MSFLDSPDDIVWPVFIEYSGGKIFIDPIGLVTVQDSNGNGVLKARKDMAMVVVEIMNKIHGSIVEEERRGTYEG